VISGVVLAAGTGSRFGGTKQIVVVDGKPLAQHAIDALSEAGVDEIVVVTGHDAVAVASALTPPRVRIVHNAAFRTARRRLWPRQSTRSTTSEGAVILVADRSWKRSIRAMIDRFTPHVGRSSGRCTPVLARPCARVRSTPKQGTSTATSARAS
jgi:CTP:molybdopterin cytidylyltransferase MocA